MEMMRNNKERKNVDLKTIFSIPLLVKEGMLPQALPKPVPLV